MSSGEKMCRTSADENLHTETIPRLSSSPQAPQAAAPTSNEGKSWEEDESNTPEEELTNKILPQSHHR
jgi:hypothetical protein